MASSFIINKDLPLEPTGDYQNGLQTVCFKNIVRYWVYKAIKVTLYVIMHV